MENNVKGKMMLLVASILMLIGSIASFLLAVFGTVLGGMAAGAGQQELSGILLVYSIVSMVMSAFEIVTAIIGIVNRAKPEKAKLCLTLGIIVTLIAIFNIVLAFTTNQFTASQILSVILPLIYVAGAFQNRPAHL